MRIIRAADCRRMPWKNGGGETVEIATSPEGAGLDAFTWRLSTARVAQDGPFSSFPGIDRTLAVLSGDGLELRIEDAVTRLCADDPPFSFAGDQPTVARLLGGPIDDLNVMTRRGVAQHRMRRMMVRGSTPADVLGDTVLVFCATGEVDAEGTLLRAGDTGVWTAVGRRTLPVGGQGTLFLIEIAATPQR